MSKNKWKILKSAVSKTTSPHPNDYFNINDIIIEIMNCYGFDLCEYVPFAGAIVSVDANNDITAGTDGGAFFEETLTDISYNTNTNTIYYNDELAGITNFVIEPVSSNAGNDISVGPDNKSHYLFLK